MHVLVTSSRTWPYWRMVHRMLDLAVQCSDAGRIKLTHGDASAGGDRAARRWAEKNPDVVDHNPMPADWDRFGKRAGFLRNEQMIATQPDICFAFIDPCVKPDCPYGPDEHDSHGAAHTVGLCEFENIPVEEFRRRTVTPAEVVDVIADMNDMVNGVGRHTGHTREKVGRCLYCSCGLRVQTG